MSIASPTTEPAFATTSDVAEAAQLHKTTLLKLRRLGPEGPFKLGRDYVHLGCGNRRLGWNKSQALKSLWSFNRQSWREVETFSGSRNPR